jgi:transposase
VGNERSSTTEIGVLRRELAARDALLAQKDAAISALSQIITKLEAKVVALESSLVQYADENELLKRRLFGPRSERTGTSELQLPLDGILDDDAPLQKQLDELVESTDGGGPDAPGAPANEGKQRPKPKGRRNLALSKLPQIIAEIKDAGLEETAKRIGFDESRQLMYRRGGFAVLVKRTAKYEIETPDGPSVLGVEMPASLFPRSLLHTSVYAWLATQKFALGVPHHRLEQHLKNEGEPLDRGTMCRAMEDLGSVLGATIVHAAIEHAKSHCKVLSTDATGAAIQPGSRDGGPKRPCKKGHFFTIVADADHVLFEYASEHSSAVVQKMFAGFRGLLQSDASSVYDILERGPPSEEGSAISLVGCWAHCRRYFFEAAICKYDVGLEGLRRIREIYRAEDPLAKLPPIERQKRRVELLGPLIDEFFAWVARTRPLVPARNLASKALGYALNQEAELRRVLLDGRLALDNTRSERALRKVVVGRKNWLFYGSEVHAQAAAAIFSIIASCRLHGLDPQQYLEEILLVLPSWPRDRYIDLAPFRWRATRALLDENDLRSPIGPVAVPELG